MIRKHTLPAAVLLAWALSPFSSAAQSEEPRRPIISEETAPLQSIAPLAKDGYRTYGYLRKPARGSRFPAVLMIHPGNREIPDAPLKDYILHAPLPAAFLAAGYVTAVTTYRSRDIDPASTEAVEDTVAALELLRGLEYVDAASVVAYGCSNGGDLAFESARAVTIAAIGAEEPATMMFTGVVNKSTPRVGERFTPRDGLPMMENPLNFYAPEHQRLTQEKLRAISAPILIQQGDGIVTRFNDAVFIPNLELAGKTFTVKTYPGEPHCFLFGPIGPVTVTTPHPAVAEQAFRDLDGFFRQHLKTQPTPMTAAIVPWER